MGVAFVTPGLLRWARERSNVAQTATAKRLDVKPETVEAWERGTKRPTLRQAQELADALHVPFGLFFLSSPPEEKLTLPDLRTVSDRLLGPSPALVDTVNDAMRKQEWFRDYQEEEGSDPLPYVGRFTLKHSPLQVADDIRRILTINALQREAPDTEEFVRRLIRKAEDVGVVVLRTGIVAGNTSRPLSVDEVRGFAISDNLAPLVFVNGRDAKTAQAFTLVHELAHLWIGQSGISNLDFVHRSSFEHNQIEAFCDRVAAETLLPSDQFLLEWDNYRNLDDNLIRLSRIHKVSQLVVLRRARDQDKVSPAQYAAKYDELRLRRAQGGAGGHYYRNLLARNSTTLTVRVVTAASEGRASYREAAHLLNIPASQIPSVQRWLNSSEFANA